jgi:mono/diheme cytochrome c family protein
MRRLALLLALLSAPALAHAQAISSWTTFEPHANPADPPLIQRGQQVFQARCNLCHGALAKDAGPGTGAWMAGTQALEAKYKGSKPAMLEDRTDLTPDVVRYFVRHGSGVMPFLRKTEVSDADLDALAAYLSRKRR